MSTWSDWEEHWTVNGLMWSRRRWLGGDFGFEYQYRTTPPIPIYLLPDDQLGMSLDITTHDEAEELLKKYTAEEIRQLWESGAFGDRPEAVKNYLFTRIIHGDLESSEE